ncbi:MAG: hypothetical protein RR954_07440 [Christensenellaceae bacterium]
MDKSASLTVVGVVGAGAGVVVGVVFAGLVQEVTVKQINSTAIIIDIYFFINASLSFPIKLLNFSFTVFNQLNFAAIFQSGGDGQIFATNRDINVVTCSIDIAATKVTAEITFVRRNYFFTWFLLCSLYYFRYCCNLPFFPLYIIYNEVSEKRRGLSRKAAKIIFYFFRFT